MIYLVFHYVFPAFKVPIPIRVSQFILLILIIPVVTGCNSTASNDSTYPLNIGNLNSDPPNNSYQIPLPDEQDNYKSTKNELYMPLALINNKPVIWTDLSRDFAEISGQTVLEEYILDLQLNNLCQQRKIVITDQLRQNEINNLLESLDPNPDIAARLWNEIRIIRGYGPARYSKLIERNAKLRALIQNDNMPVNEAAIITMFEQLYGQRYLIRIITCDTYAQAQELLEKARNHEPFYELAAKYSTDVSADRGGLLDPVSPADPVYPMTIRQVLADLTPEEPSPILAIDTGFAIVQLVEKLPEQNVKLIDVRDSLEKLIVKQQENTMMHNLAKQLLSEADIIIMDKSLDWSWNQRKTAE